MHAQNSISRRRAFGAKLGPEGSQGGFRRRPAGYQKCRILRKIRIETHVPNLFGKTRGDAPFKKHCILRIKTALRAPSGGLEGSSKSPKMTQKAREAKNSKK